MDKLEETNGESNIIDMSSYIYIDGIIYKHINWALGLYDNNRDIQSRDSEV